MLPPTVARQKNRHAMRTRVHQAPQCVRQKVSPPLCALVELQPSLPALDSLTISSERDNARGRCEIGGVRQTSAPTVWNGVTTQNQFYQVCVCAQGRIRRAC